MTESAFLTKLNELRSDFCASMPTPELAVLSRTVGRLRRTGIDQSCLQVGETAPDFEFIDAGNTAQRLSSVLQNGPVVLNFFRGNWCPYCKTELEAYQNIQSDLDELGATYIAVSPQRPEMMSDAPDNYQVIFDRDNRIAGQFGIVFSLDEAERQLFSSWGLDLCEVNGSDTWELPVPAVFIVCPNRTIGYEYVDVDFRSRCCPEQLIEELKTFCGC